MNEGGWLALIMLLLLSALFASGYYTGHREGYADGYIDACKDAHMGKLKYALFENPDGTKEWKKR